ncbi:hydrogenase nickel incorporation protein HypB [Amycolatopsis carbonis]|uniref:Hydrogenase nickel incorporation protein HypB n=1 Tax=Amycolatopsis carbonis TaxID=715471 RepID=A0A9Y2IL95_9PSEU|nr:hydrogenase nickel incorporation protein HypB [Amycolatopsis sp. 2-15]WIX80398.1 hydrogenase nickel incorporation protein HypB [Amycolatopsis sp. 2-15]
MVLEQDVLAKNDHLAGHNRSRLRDLGVFAVNLMSSPGAGKTTLLEQTVHALGASVPLAVVEGDQETLLDADRIKASGAPVVQINTGAGCHLDATMLSRALDTLAPARGSVLFVENVGNLVCPALFDLGEAARVVIMSVTEGPGKPLKYPHMFASTDLVLLNKVDLLPYVSFSVPEFLHDLRHVNPDARVVEISATRGDGLDEWYGWLRRRPDRG